MARRKRGTSSASKEPVWIFDRSRDRDPWRPALEELRLSPDAARRALGANWRMDHRVSKSREAGDLAGATFFRGATRETTWLQGLEIYSKEEIAQPSRSGATGKVSAYLRPTNSSNDLSTRVSSFDQLVHVSCLQTLIGRFQAGERDTLNMSLRTLDPALRVRDRPRTSDPMSWINAEAARLADGLSRHTEDDVKRVVGWLADAMGDFEPPWWAAFADEVNPLIDASDAAGLCVALGLGHRQEGDWLLVWRYSVEAAGSLFRPTVAEAYRTPFHFPSPPGYPWGITMPLDPVMPGYREAVHPPLRGDAAANGSIGRLLLLAGFRSSYDPDRLASLRASQRERLHREFPVPEIDDWLTRHHDLE